MANENHNQKQESPTKDERLLTLELENAQLKKVVRVCVEELLEAAMYGNVKRAREGVLRNALAELGPVG